MSIIEAEKSFYDITKNRRSNASFINAFNIFKIEETKKYFLNIFRTASFNNINPTFFIYRTIDYGEWWDNIAYEYYGNEDLWWVTPLINDIENPFEDPPAGEEIKILKQDFLYDLLVKWRNLSEK